MQWMQLLHERNTLRTTFASRCRALNSESSWNRCKLHFQITSSISDRFTLFLQLWNALDEFYNFMSLRYYNICESIAAVSVLHERNIKRQAQNSIFPRKLQISLLYNIINTSSIQIIFAVVKSFKWDL